MEQIAILAGIAFLINKIVTVVKAVGKDNNMVVTQLVVWAVSVGVLFLASAAEVFKSLTVPGLAVALGDLDFPSLLLISLILGSTGSFAYDALKSIDNTRSGDEPRLLPGSVPHRTT